MSTLTYNKSVWLTAQEAVDLLNRHGYNLSVKSFYENISRRWSARTRPHPSNSHRTLYHRGDLLFSPHDLKTAAFREARQITADADASGHWLTFQQAYEIAHAHGVISHAMLYRQISNLIPDAPIIRSLFPQSKLHGIALNSCGLQRYRKEDVEASREYWLERAARIADRTRLPEVDRLPSQLWVSLTSIAPNRSSTYFRLARLINDGILQACLLHGMRHVDAMEAREILNWRTIPWVRKHWTPEELAARLAWQQENNITCPWGGDHPNSLKIYAPDLAHL